MASVFHDIDCRYNPDACFWQRVDTRNQESLVSKTIFGGELRIRRANGSLKSRRCVLTKSHIYFLSKWNIPKFKANINWKTVEPFTEQVENFVNYGFRISGSHSEDFYTKTQYELDQWLDSLCKVGIITSYDEDIMIIKQLAKGSGTAVHLCQSADDLCEYAIKTVNKSALAGKPEVLQVILNEIVALRLLSHPNIVKLYKVYETDTDIHLLLEYIPHGDLYKRVKDLKRLPENEALELIRKLIQTLEYLHSMNIVHRDIKLENIVMTGTSNTDFKLIDFGLACDFKLGLLQGCGTPGWVAPEILRGSLYGCQVDMFSVGVLLFAMLSGKMPFEGKTYKEILEQNRKCKIVYKKIGFSGISKDTMSLLNALLVDNPAMRLSSKEALESPSIKRLIQPLDQEKVELVSSVYTFENKTNTFDYQRERISFHSAKSMPMKNNYIY